MRDLRWLGLLLLAAALPAQAGLELGDPTRPALLPPSVAEDEPGGEGPRLRSIIVSGDRRTAVVDGERVEIGDPAAGGRVVAIEMSGVRVRRGDGDLVLTLTGSGYKQPATPRRKKR